MKSNFAAAREFVRGAARFHDLVYVLSKGKALLQQGIAHSSVIAVDQGQWADVVDTDWDATAIAVARIPADHMILVGEDGDVATHSAGAVAHEKINPAPILICNAHPILGNVFACGMKRQVYKRLAEGAWVDISAPLPDPKERVGFEAIDGYSDDEIYAVGWNGEIWQFDGATWTDRGSPTSVILTAVCCAPNQVVYAAGQHGVLIRGRSNSWELVQWEDETTSDLWDLCWFEDKLYISTMTGLYTIGDNRLINVDMGLSLAPTCYSMTYADGVLWSIGRDDIVSFDGSRWEAYQ